MFKAAAMVGMVVLAGGPAFAQHQIEPKSRRELEELQALKEKSRREDDERSRVLAFQQEGEELASETKYLWPALSAHACAARDGMANAKDAIKEERALAKRSGGGVLDLERIHEQQENFRTAETYERNVRVALAEVKKKPMRCSAPVVTALMICGRAHFGGGFKTVHESEVEACKDERLRPYLAVEAHYWKAWGME